MMRFARYALKRLVKDEYGVTLVELAIVIPLLLLFVMGAVEFGRLGYNETMAQKATDLAARTAAVRPAAWCGVPTEYQPDTTSGTNPRFGTLCRVGNTCAAPTAPFVSTDGRAEFRCTLADSNATTDEIWATIAPLLPNTVERSNIQLRYTHDNRIGFLGGPYRPIVTAEIVDLEFQFITPLGALAGLALGGGTSTISNTIPFPNMSASLPAEDLGQGLATN